MQHLMFWLNRPFAPKTLQGHDCRLRYSRGFLERHPGRLQSECLLMSTYILGKSTIAVLDQVPDNLIARPEPSHGFTHRFDLPGHIQSQTAVLRPT